MPRIRSIHPEMWQDDRFVSWPRDLRLFYIGMWCFLDDAGRCEDSPRTLRLHVFPDDSDITNEVVKGWLETLEGEGRIHRYIGHTFNKGKALLHVPTFEKYQRPDHPSIRLDFPPCCGGPEPNQRRGRPKNPQKILAEDYPNINRGVAEDSAREQDKELEREKERDTDSSGGAAESVVSSSFWTALRESWRANASLPREYAKLDIALYPRVTTEANAEHARALVGYVFGCEGVQNRRPRVRILPLLPLS